MLHAFIEYLKYSWKAKGRHGTHSPFVYDFVEQVTLNKDVIDRKYIVSYPSLPLKYENLLSRIASYYKYEQILRLPASEGMSITSADMLLLSDARPQEWVQLMNEHYHLLNNNSAVAVVGIHKSPAHTKGWMQLCKDPKVRMSIDMYGVGVLFFKEEFKVPQQFILQY